MAHLSPYPATVIERAIERGQREWEYRPPIAKMLAACDSVLRDAPKPEPRGDDWKRNTLGGYTVWRGKELSDAWFSGRQKLSAEAKAAGWWFSLHQAVGDGANILAQTEWQRRQSPEWNPAQRYCENLRHDPVRGEWEIFISQDKLNRWRGRAA